MARSVFNLFGLGKKSPNSGTKVSGTPSLVMSYADKPDLEAFKSHYDMLCVKVAGYKRVTREKPHLVEATKDALNKVIKTDALAFIFEDLQRLSMLYDNFRKMEELLNRPTQDNLNSFNKLVSKLKKETETRYELAQMISNMNRYNSDNSQWIVKDNIQEALYAVNKTTLMNDNRAYDIENYSLHILERYSRVVGYANKFFQDICKRGNETKPIDK